MFNFFYVVIFLHHFLMMFIKFLFSEKTLVGMYARVIKNKYSILPITRTSKGPMKMVRVYECSSYPG